jgi:GntR family transcriptional regulator
MSDKSTVRDRRPLVLQLRDEFVRLIDDGELAPGDRLPSEPELASRFVASRGTVREAFKLLEQDGLVDVEHGRGRFVSAEARLRVTRPVTAFESVTEMLRGRGFEPETRLLHAERRAATAPERGALAPTGGEVVELIRLRSNGGEPLIVSVNVIDAALLEDEPINATGSSGSLSQWLAERGRRPISSAAEALAVTLPADIDAKAAVAYRGPWLLIRERCVDDTGRIVILAWDYHRGDIFSFDFVRRRGTVR